MSLSALLLPEFQEEIKKTRSMLEALPEGRNDFKPHEKSMTLGKLAGHMAQMPAYVSRALESPDVDFFEVRLVPLVFETKPQVLAAYGELADHALTAIKGTSDEVFEQTWTVTRKGHRIFSGTRYNAYRMMGMDHMIHHRGQLGVYLRLLETPLPSIYGPSADTPLP